MSEKNLKKSLISLIFVHSDFKLKLVFFMLSSSVSHHKSHQVRQSDVQTIKRQIPGSNLEVSFTIQKDAGNKPIVQATIKIVVNKIETKIIPNVPIESFPSDPQTNISFDEALQVLRTNALDYVIGKIIVLPKSTDQLASKKASKKVVDAYHSLGNKYFYSSKYREALLLFQQMFTIAENLKDIDGIRLAHRNLGHVYHKLGETERAMSHHEQELSLLQNRQHDEIRKVYLSLGNIHESCGYYDKAIEWYTKHLRVSSKLNSELDVSYFSLGNAYIGLGDYAKARKCFEKSLNLEENREALNGLGTVYMNLGYYKSAILYFEKVLKMTSDSSDKGEIFANLGLASQKLGRFSEARKFHKEDLAIAVETENCESKARACFNLGSLCMAQEDYIEGLNYISKILDSLKKLKDRHLEGMIYGFIGNCYFYIDNKEESVKYHKKHLEIANELNDSDSQISAYNNLGRTYTFLTQYREAIENYEKAIAVAIRADDKDAQASLYHNLGRTYHFSQEFDKAIKYFLLSIEVYSTLHKENCKDSLQWQVSFFDTQFRPYRCLEQAILGSSKEEALLIADSSRGRALISLIERKLSLPAEQKFSLEDMKNAAIRFQTIIVMYSCDPFDDAKAWCWVICPKNGVIYQDLKIRESSSGQEDQMLRSAEDGEIRGKKLQKDASQWIVDIEKDAYRGSDTTASTMQHRPEQLREWHDNLIAPIEHLLPKNGERVTFIPDAFLHDLPFALFQDDGGTYLFEKCTLITVPSVATLVRIEDLSKVNKFCRKLDDICMVTNSELNQEFDLSELEGVKEERTIVAEFFESTSELDPIVEEVKKNMSESGHIHVSCHGLADEKENEHSVFEGALVMTGKLLYTEDIVDLPLNAELAFLSACSSGKGKVYREGTVGLPFAFLAGGVSSVIATRWQIFDKSTPKIVEEFYKHYRGRSKQAKDALAAGKPFGQAEALREAMLFAKKTYPTKPQVWGAFFLTGLPGNIQNDESINRQAEQFANLDPLKVWKEDGENNVCFYLKDEIVITKLFKKNSEKELDDSDRDFPEEKIQVYMTSRSQVKRIGQIQRQVNDLRLEEKRELLESLLRRKIIVKDDKIIICALP